MNGTQFLIVIPRMCCKPQVVVSFSHLNILITTAPTKKNKKNVKANVNRLNPLQKQLAYLFHIVNFANDVEGLNPIGIGICGKKSVAREDKAANVVSLLPTVQDRGAQPASYAKLSPKRNSFKHSIQLILYNHTTSLPLSWSI